MSLRYSQFVAALTLMSFAVGCATAVRGVNDTISVQSIPEGAFVTTDLRDPATGDFYDCAATPCSISLPRRSSAIVTVSHEGYPSIRFPIVSSVTTSNDVLPPGTQIAGVLPGPIVVVGTPSRGSQITLRSASITSGFLTFGASTVLDAATGANHNLVPREVTVVFEAPVEATPLTEEMLVDSE